MRRGARRCIVENLERGQDLGYSRTLLLVTATFPGPKFQFRNSDRGNANRMAFILNLPAALDQSTGMVTRLAAGGGFQTTNHVDERIRVEKINHAGHSRRSTLGCLRPSRIKSSDNSSTPS